ncbi:MAG: hypothetical protein ACLFO6_08235, partial [Archaeoglobaceae archaeon]
MRTRDIVISAASILLLILFVTNIVSLDVTPLILIAIFAVLATTPYFVKDYRLRFFAYLFFGALIYWTVGRMLESPDILADYFFILGLGIANATGAIIATVERKEHSYIYPISAIAVYFSSFLMEYTTEYPDISTLAITLLVVLSAIWVHFFLDLKGAQMGPKEHLTASLKTAVITSPIYLLLVTIPSYFYHITDVGVSEIGVVLFRYILLSFLVVFAGSMIRDFVAYLAGYKRDYHEGRAV